MTEETHDVGLQPQGWPRNAVEPGASDLFVEAAKEFALEGHMPGDVVPRQRFHDLLGIPAPAPKSAWEQAEKLKLKFVGAFERFRGTLLIEHSIALRPVPGLGYTVIAPGKQAVWALEKFNDDLADAFSKGLLRATHIRTAGLTLSQKNEQQQVLAQLAMLKGHVTAGRLKARRDRTALRALGKNGGKEE